MFHDRWVNKKINKIHKRALRIGYKDICSRFEDSLKKGRISVHIPGKSKFACYINLQTQRILNPRFMKQEN